MTKLIKDSLTFENGFWECKIANGSQEISIRIKGDNQLFNLRENLDLADKFIGELGQYEKLARIYATDSEYHEDIKSVGGLHLSAVHLDGWSDFRIWFHLGDDPERMLGVHYANGKWVSIYCDPP